MAQDMTTTKQQEVAERYDGGAMSTRRVYQPRTDIYETENEIHLLVEMPGVGPDDVDVTLERQVLTIRGRTPESEHEGYGLAYAEYSEGDYERVFTLSEEIDRKGIKASQKDGVLTLALPKSKEAQARKIKVKGT